ncbi:MAG: molybdopterin converting factor subunit 1 [Pseudomonadota bacterium]
MIRVLFFGSVREQVGTDGIDLGADEAGPTLSTLRAALAARGPAWAGVFGDNDRLLAAVNQQTTTMESSLDDGDEVAFFPPVTGG